MQKIISANSRGKDDIFLFDIFISLDIKPDRPPFLIGITKKRDFATLHQQIREDVQELFDEFKGLKGLRVKDMKI